MLAKTHDSCHMRENAATVGVLPVYVLFPALVVVGHWTTKSSSSQSSLEID
jgi:hypothetical protein